MQYEPTTPQQDGFSMPAEFSPHQGCILIWPERPGSWKNGAAAARKAFRSVIAAIAESETVLSISRQAVRLFQTLCRGPSCF